MAEIQANIDLGETSAFKKEWLNSVNRKGLMEIKYFSRTMEGILSSRPILLFLLYSMNIANMRSHSGASQSDLFPIVRSFGVLIFTEE